MQFVDPQRDLDLRAEHNSRKLADEGNDRRVGKEDLAAVAPRLAAWGVRLDDPAAELARLAAEHGGSVFFPDFAHGALVAALTAMAGAAEVITE